MASASSNFRMLSAGSPPSPPAPSTVTPREPLLRDRGSVLRDQVRADRWLASGFVKVSGAVDVRVAQLRGTVSVGGRVLATELRARGTLEVEGPVEVPGTLATGGSAHFADSVHAGDLETTGSVRFASAPRVDRTFTARGAVVAPALQVGLLDLDGTAQVPGEVVALRVDAVFRRSSVLGTVRAPVVRLRGRLPNVMDKAFFHTLWTRVGRVEADRVELEGLSVAFVRAREIVLGRASHVDEFEGQVVEQHPTSSVGPESKSPPPYGLRR